MRLSATVQDVTGALVNAGALTLLVKTAAADGTWTTTGTYTTPTNDSTGLYHQDIPVTDLVAAGHYQYTWTSTGTGAGVSFGEFDVFDPFETSVLPLQDAKDALNIPQATTTSDAEIASYIATIKSNLEKATGGPLVNRTVTERSEMMSNQTVIPVRQRPLVSVTSIASASGSNIDISGGLDLDVNAGAHPAETGPAVLRAVLHLAAAGHRRLRGRVGRVSVPAAFNTFARIVLQHLWNTQRGPRVAAHGRRRAGHRPRVRVRDPEHGRRAASRKPGRRAVHQRGIPMSTDLDPRWDWIEVTPFGSRERQYVQGSCRHTEVAPVESVDGKIVAQLCLTCDTQLPQP